MTETQKEDELDSIKKRAKRFLFRTWKFYHKKPHGEYSDNDQTMCELLMKCMRKKEAERWWLEIRKTVIKRTLIIAINASRAS